MNARFACPEGNWLTESCINPKNAGSRSFLTGSWFGGIKLKDRSAGGWRSGFSLVFWGLGVRMVYVLHVTWMINSVTHMWGYRRYETSDDSRNLWWVGLLAFGEGWHNKHHAHQRSARHGMRWWEFDVTYSTVQLLRILGLARNIILYPLDKNRRPVRLSVGSPPSSEGPASSIVSGDADPTTLEPSAMD